ncbi:hypothetical protein Tco_0071776 [Tanacetum coccineum]
MTTRSVGRTTDAPRGGRTSGRTGRGGGRTGDQDGQGGDRGVEGNRGVDEVPNFSMIIAQQLQNLLPSIITQIGKSLTWWNTQTMRCKSWNQSFGVTPWSELAMQRTLIDSMSLLATEPTSNQSAVLKAGILTDEAIKTRVLKKNTEKRGNDGELTRTVNVKDDNKRSRNGRAFTATNNPVKKEYTGSAPKAECPRLIRAPGQGGNRLNQAIAIDGGQGLGFDFKLGYGAFTSSRLETPMAQVHVLDFEGLTPKMRQDLAVRLRMVYTRGEGKQVFVSYVWRRLFGIRAPFVREFILEFLSTCRMSDTKMGMDVADTLCFQLGGVKRRMTWTQFILVLGLHTEQEMTKVGFGAYWDGSDRLIPDKGDLRDYWIEISFDKDFFGPALLFVFYSRPCGGDCCHRMINYILLVRGTANRMGGSGYYSWAVGRHEIIWMNDCIGFSNEGISRGMKDTKNMGRLGASEGSSREVARGEWDEGATKEASYRNLECNKEEEACMA